MPPATDSLHEALRGLGQLTRDLVSELSDVATPGTRRATEFAATQAVTPGGVARAELLQLMASESGLILATLTMFVDGVADCLEIAAGRENAVNVPAMSSDVRPALELAGQLVWLLDERIDGEERGRRYLIWVFSDLNHRRRALSDFRIDVGE